MIQGVYVFCIAGGISLPGNPSGRSILQVRRTDGAERAFDELSSYGMTSDECYLYYVANDGIARRRLE
jgi:hypothetical protein